MSFKFTLMFGILILVIAPVKRRVTSIASDIFKTAAYQTIFVCNLPYKVIILLYIVHEINFSIR